MKKDAILFSACQYQKASVNINDLPGGRFDIVAISTRLNQIGFDVTINENATRDIYIPDLQKCVSKSPSDAVHIVYFTGHGGHYNGNNYIFPSDFGVNLDATHDVSQAGINIREIINVFQGHGRLILILDSCRADIAASKGYFAEFTYAENVYIAYGTQFQNTSTGVNNTVSWFTEGICDEILAPNIDVDMLFTNVRRNVFLKHGGQIPSSMNALLEKVVLHEEIIANDLDTKVYEFVEKFGDEYNEKHGYFKGENLVFIDAAQSFNISLLDAYWKYTKVSNAIAVKKGIPIPILSESESKLVTFFCFTKSKKSFYCDENYTWYYNGRQIRMGEIPPLPPSMQQKLPEQGKGLLVKMQCLRIDGTIKITTTLPDGCEFFVDWEKVKVHAGSVLIKHELKSDKIVIDSGIFSDNDDIKRILGEKSRNLTGPLIRYDAISGNMLHCSFDL